MYAAFFFTSQGSVALFNNKNSSSLKVLLHTARAFRSASFIGSDC